MSRTTIDFGIDLGTTNSAIAELKGVSTEIIKNNSDGDITPSAVSMDKHGTLQVGQRARNRLIDQPEDAYAEFKRRMGTDHSYTFKSSGQVRSPEQLSSEVLKSLRADVQQRTGEVIEGAVITVPAAFELHQCDATRKAALLAGFKECPLLQEPIAAALAYGFQAAQQKGYWLVYDFGGGTFDAALIQSEDGAIQVVNHGGDNFLGGSDIDWAIVEELLVPRLLEQHLLEDFRRGNPQWRQAFAKLKRAAEMAKIDLSRAERTVIETCRFPDANGDTLEFDGDLSREQVVRVARPIIQRSIDICQRVMAEKNLQASAVEKIILVGGPTLAPYFRQLLAEGLRIPLDHSADPLTVVARGASIFAGTQRMAAPSNAIAPTRADGFSLDLKYKPVGMDSDPDIGGKISGPEGKELTGFVLEFTNDKTKWRSGRIPLQPGGVFLTSLHAEKGERNVFRIQLFDATGQQHSVQPAELHYTIGAVVQEQPLIHSMGIALANNHYERYFEKGAGLPLRATRSFRTMEPLVKGSSGALLRIPLIEGDQTLADRNRSIGTLEIMADSIKRDLPGNSDIDVTLSMSTDRIIRILAYVPLLDDTFEGKVDMARYTPNAQALAKDFQCETGRLKKAIADFKASDSAEAEKVDSQFNQSPLLHEVQTLLASSPGDPDAAAKCERRLLELKLRMDDWAGQIKWPRLVADARTLVNDCSKLANRYGSASHRERAQELSDEVDEVIRDRRADRIERKIEQLASLWNEIASSQPEYWINHFRRVEEQRQSFSDPARGAALLEQGNAAIARSDITVLRSVVVQLFSLLKSEAPELEQRGYQSGILR